MAHSKSEIKKAKNLLNKFAPTGEQLAYINSKEARLLKSKGGAGKMTKAGIRSYAYSDSRDDPGGDNQTGNSSNNDNNGGGNDYTPVSARSRMQNTAPVKPQSMLSRIGDFIKGGMFTGMLLKGAKNQLEYLNAKRKNKLAADTFIDPFGRGMMSTTKNPNFNNGGGNETATTQVAKNLGGKIIKSPTTAEVSQSSATDVTYDARKTKARGRSLTIRTNSRGVGNNMASVLGKKSLLGAA